MPFQYLTIKSSYEAKFLNILDRILVISRTRSVVFEKVGLAVPVLVKLAKVVETEFTLKPIRARFGRTFDILELPSDLIALHFAVAIQLLKAVAYVAVIAEMRWHVCTEISFSDHS